MKIIVNSLDNNSAVFLLELLQRFAFKEVQIITDEDILFLENENNVAVKLPMQKQVEQITDKNIAISPFVMSMVSENAIPADYDYKTDYKNHLSKKYA